MRVLLLATLVLSLLAAPVQADNRIVSASVGVAILARDVASAPDAYAIMAAHYQASGGLKRWQQLTRSFASGSVIYDGLRGSFKCWERHPLQTRLEEDFGSIRQVQGDSGVSAWRLDYNGQVELLRDPETLTRRELARHLSNFEHLQRQSRLFSLHLDGQQQRNGQLCYVVRLENSLNSDVTRFYLATDTLLMVASHTHQPDIEITSSYSDYRKIAGLWLAFHQSDDISPRQKHYETQITTLVLNPPIEATTFAVPEAQLPELKFPHSQHSVAVPILLVDGAIYLQVTINNSRGWWLLDSGASSSIIDADYAKSLQLQSSGWIRGFGYGDNFNLSLVQLPGLSVGDKNNELHLAAHVVMAYAGLTSASYEPQMCGILGYDFISRFVARIDYGQQQITLYDPHRLPAAVVKHWLDAPLKYRMFTLPVCIDDNYCGRWSIDLGAERSSVNAPYVQQHRHLAQLRANGLEHVSKGLTTPSIDKLVRFTSLEVAGWQLDDPVISLSMPVATGSSTMGELAGNLGAAQLQNFVLWLDYPNQRVAFMRGAQFGVREQLDRSGMLVGMSTDNQQPMISFVAPDTPAHRGGFVAGDKIVAIDGQPVASYGGVRNIRNLLRNPAAICYEFQLQRAGASVTLQLYLEDLL
ncbi:MAG: aspartyl protease family protein [Desulfuromonas sp.]|nr:aspartyl protease family protein [Desulfuromonas sp.]